MTTDRPGSEDTPRTVSLGGPVRLRLTRLCLRSGTVQLPFSARNALPDGAWVARDRSTGEPLRLRSTPPRTVSGFRGFFAHHGLDVNDTVTLHVEDGVLVVDVEKRVRRPIAAVEPSTWHSLVDEARTAPEPRASTSPYPTAANAANGGNASHDDSHRPPPTTPHAPVGDDPAPPHAVGTVRVVRTNVSGPSWDDADGRDPVETGIEERESASGGPRQATLPFVTPTVDDAPKAPSIQRRRRIPGPTAVPTVPASPDEPLLANARDAVGALDDRGDADPAPGPVNGTSLHDPGGADVPTEPGPRTLSFWSRLWRRGDRRPSDARVVGDAGDSPASARDGAPDERDEVDDHDPATTPPVDRAPDGVLEDEADRADDRLDDRTDARTTVEDDGRHADVSADDWTDAWRAAPSSHADSSDVFGASASVDDVSSEAGDDRTSAANTSSDPPDAPPSVGGEDGADADDAPPQSGPIDRTVDEPTEEAAGEPMDEPTDEPAHERLDEPGDEPGDEPRDELADDADADDDLANDDEANDDEASDDEGEDGEGDDGGRRARGPTGDGTGGRRRTRLHHDGDLRTRLVRFLTNPQMDVVAKSDVVARRFGLDVAMAAALLEDIAEVPPPGIRLVKVRDGAWRIERTTA